MSDVNTKPPKNVSDEAELGLKLRKLFNRGGTSVGVARARDLKNRENLSEDTIKRMVSFFARHGAQIDRRDEGWENKENPSAEWIAWLLWGGDSGRDWSQRKREEFKMQETKKSYIEETIKSAKELLKPWHYVAIKNLYKSHHDLIEKISIQEISEGKLKDIDDEKLRVTWLRVNQWYNNALDDDKPTEKFISAGKKVASEMKKRGFELTESDFTRAIDSFKNKGLYNLEDVKIPYEGGIHYHDLYREDLSTKHDGVHRHIFLLNDVNLITSLNGSHTHNLEFEDSNSISGGGEHNHKLVLPKGLILPGGRILSEEIEITTDYSGEHSHELQVYKTSSDGSHSHSIRLPDETVITSMSPGEYWRNVKLRQSGSLEASLESPELRKSGPTASDVHVPNAGARKPPLKRKKKLKPGEKEESKLKSRDDLKKSMESNSLVIKSIEKTNPDYMFVIDSPSKIDIEKGSINIDDDFEDIYIKPLGIIKSDAAFSLAVPVPVLSKQGRTKPPTSDEINKWSGFLLKEIDRINPKVLIAVGRLSRLSLKGIEDLTLPNYKIAKIHKKQEEINKSLLKLPGLISKRLKIKRKDGKILKDHDINKEILLNDSKNDSFNVNIIKSDDDKRIVYSVVLDPYQVDAHNDWIPPSEIERTAHNWFKKSRIISLNHEGPSDSKAVESFLVEYPTKEDYKKAMRAEPHEAYARKFGNDVVYSGSWILGTELSEEDYELFKSGELNSYSIEGFGVKRKADKKEMPSVNFIRVSE